MTMTGREGGREAEEEKNKVITTKLTVIMETRGQAEPGKAEVLLVPLLRGQG